MLDKFRLRKSLEKRRDCLFSLKVSKNNGNESSLSEFLISPFSPAMPKPMLKRNTSLAARENASLTPKKRESLLESKLQALSAKISSLQSLKPVIQGTVSLLNMCIGEENQSSLKTDKEVQILGKELKKQMKENKSLLV